MIHGPLKMSADVPRAHQCTTVHAGKNRVRVFDRKMILGYPGGPVSSQGFCKVAGGRERKDCIMLVCCKDGGRAPLAVGIIIIPGVSRRNLALCTRFILPTSRTMR